MIVRSEELSEVKNFIHVPMGVNMICAFDASSHVPEAVRRYVFSVTWQNMFPASLCLFLTTTSVST